MKCGQCQVIKPSKEFPDKSVSSKCEHATSWCLECLVSYLRETQHRCPICEVELTEQEVNNFCLFWDDANSGVFFVVLLNGKKITLKLSEITTVKALKYALKDATNIDIMKQKLIYNDMELNDFQDDSTNSTLENYGIHANSNIQLIIVPYSITQDQGWLTFDLYWGYPHSGQDFLDGTCLIYVGDKLWRKYDYKSTYYPDIPYIKHSGDVMDNTNANGCHKITIKLDALPNEVGQLYFILSSRRSPTIGHFRNPNFKLYDEANPDRRELCDYNIEQAKNSQAVIMCLINRLNNGRSLY
ncbi:tellurium resistance protein terz-like [Gigaspora margarita]|uniref:Tellurium resistance protein terz-like n=1 Tax=Gigaspora margarita TaxID=4874 RepID=A0A8H3X6A2_GIGMA|nr:tellurium resistance protein terz-like [Gigaspora margarita]